MTAEPDLLASPAEKQKIYAFNSTVLYLLAYFIVYGLQQFITILIARFNHIPAALFPGHIDFKIPDKAWQIADVVSTYGAGPFACLLLGFAATVIFNKIKHLGGLRKLFYVWLSLHSFNLFFGGLIAGTIARGGFWYAVRWSIHSDAATIGFAIIFGLLLLVIGFLSAPGFLISCDSITLIQFVNRKKLLLSMVMIPWLAGNLVLFLLKFPDLNKYEGLLSLTMMLILVPVYFFNLGNPISETVEEPRKIHFAFGLGIGLILLLLVFRLSLQNGISFG